MNMMTMKIILMIDCLSDRLFYKKLKIIYIDLYMNY